MSNGAAAAIAQAKKASGVILRLTPDEFLKVLGHAEAPLVVISQARVFSRQYSYVSSCKGLAFFTKSSESLLLPGNCETVRAKAIWIP
jgi:hypothetical protein